MFPSQVDWLLGQCRYNTSVSELLNWTFQDWRINHVKIREPKQAPKVWCRSSSPPNIRNNSSSIITCAKILSEYMVKRRRRGHPAMAAVRNKPLTNSKETGTGLQPMPAHCFWKLSQGGTGMERGGCLVSWSASSGWLAFFFSLVFFNKINRSSPFGCTRY